MVGGCQGNCKGELSIMGERTSKIKTNKKCRNCQIRLNTDSNRCYCCKYPLSSRKNSKHELRRKETLGLIARL